MVFTEHLWTGWLDVASVLGLPLIRIQTRIWEIHGANYTALLSFRVLLLLVLVWFWGLVFFVIEKDYKSEHCLRS